MRIGAPISARTGVLPRIERAFNAGGRFVFGSGAKMLSSLRSLIFFSVLAGIGGGLPGCALVELFDNPIKAADASLPTDAKMDSSIIDAMPPDAVIHDAMIPDTIIPDAITPDAMKLDAMPLDGMPIDAVPIDARPIDAGAPDATGCVPVSLEETEFKDIAGNAFINIDYWSLYGSLILKRNWTEEWKADGGMLPTWTLYAPSGANGQGTATLTTDPLSGGVDVLNMNTLSCAGCTAPPAGSDQYLYYSISPNFTAAGGVVQVSWRLVAEETGSPFYGCEASVEIANGSRIYRPGMMPGSIVDPLSTSVNFATDTQTQLFTLRVEFINDTVRYFVNEQGPQADTNTNSTGNNRIRFSDNCGNTDGQAYVRQIAYYNGGDHVPFNPMTGSFTRIFDFGSPVSSFTNIIFNGNTPALTSILFETRSGNTATPDITWSSWAAATGGTITSPLARYLQVRATLSTSDNLVSAMLYDFRVNGCQ